jgi:D-serine dehydratase
VKNKIKKIKDIIKSNLLDENILQNENERNKINIDILNDEFKKKAKEKIQQKYFGQKLNEGVLLLNYSNEISAEGGINLILDNAENLITNYGLQILISGKINLNG